MPTTLKLTGYLVAAAAVTLSGTQQLNSLADNEYTDPSDEIDNGTNKYAFADLYADVASAAFITPADCGLDVFLIPCVDGTNYPTWTGNTTTDNAFNDAHFVGRMPFTGTTAAQDATLLRVALPNGKYKFAFRNRGNVTLAGSANVVYWRPHSFDAV